MTLAMNALAAPCNNPLTNILGDDDGDDVAEWARAGNDDDDDTAAIMKPAIPVQYTKASLLMRGVSRFVNTISPS